MSGTDKELASLLEGIERFLVEQRETTGNYIMRTPKKVSGESPAESGQHAGEQPDLFGGNGFRIRKQAPPIHTNAYPQEPWANATSLVELEEQICECVKCPLGQTRTKFVFGVGNPNADLVLVGEAPGADEDAQGEPFVGRAGQLLNKILEAIGFRREDVYICNILKCRPPNNRDPQPSEVEHCEPYLWKQLELMNPKLILCLGRISGQVLLRTTASLAQLRGKVHDYRGIKLMVTYHPAALLRNPHWKRPTWEDVQEVRKLYDTLTSRP